MSSLADIRKRSRLPSERPVYTPVRKVSPAGVPAVEVEGKSVEVLKAKVHDLADRLYVEKVRANQLERKLRAMEMVNVKTTLNIYEGDDPLRALAKSVDFPPDES